MTVAAETNYSVWDLDRTLKQQLLDDIDYAYRFRDDNDKTLQDVITDMMDDLNDTVKNYYGEISGLDFNITVEDLATAYKELMM